MVKIINSKLAVYYTNISRALTNVGPVEPGTLVKMFLKILCKAIFSSMDGLPGRNSWFRLCIYPLAADMQSTEGRCSPRIFKNLKNSTAQPPFLEFPIDVSPDCFAPFFQFSRSPIAYVHCMYEYIYNCRLYITSRLCTMLYLKVF